ncbi:MAG: STAS domain-containing protein [Armatimonadota bacterium]
MQFEPIKLDTEVTKSAETHIVKVQGEVDVYTAPELKAVLHQAIDVGAVTLVVDLSNVEYMDSSGFGTLLGATKRLRPDGGKISLAGCNKAITRMLQLTRLDSIFDMYESVDEALASQK